MAIIHGMKQRIRQSVPLLMKLLRNKTLQGHWRVGAWLVKYLVPRIKIVNKGDVKELSRTLKYRGDVATSRFHFHKCREFRLHWSESEVKRA